MEKFDFSEYISEKNILNKTELSWLSLNVRICDKCTGLLPKANPEHVFQKGCEFTVFHKICTCGCNKIIAVESDSNYYESVSFL